MILMLIRPSLSKYCTILLPKYFVHIQVLLCIILNLTRTLTGSSNRYSSISPLVFHLLTVCFHIFWRWKVFHLKTELCAVALWFSFSLFSWWKVVNHLYALQPQACKYYQPSVLFPTFFRIAQWAGLSSKLRVKLHFDYMLEAFCYGSKVQLVLQSTFNTLNLFFVWK